MSAEIESFRKYLFDNFSMDIDTFEESIPYLNIETISKGDYFIRKRLLKIKTI